MCVRGRVSFVVVAAAIAVLTGLLGANTGASLLDAAGVRDPATRGLAMGSVSHSLGTAALADEPDAFAFSAVAFALTAVFTTLLLSAPPLKAALVALALGPT